MISEVKLIVVTCDMYLYIFIQEDKHICEYVDNIYSFNQLELRMIKRFVHHYYDVNRLYTVVEMNFVYMVVNHLFLMLIYY